MSTGLLPQRNSLEWVFMAGGAWIDWTEGSYGRLPSEAHCAEGPMRMQLRAGQGSVVVSTPRGFTALERDELTVRGHELTWSLDAAEISASAIKFQSLLFFVGGAVAIPTGVHARKINPFLIGSPDIEDIEPDPALRPFAGPTREPISLQELAAAFRRRRSAPPEPDAPLGLPDDV